MTAALPSFAMLDYQVMSIVIFMSVEKCHVPVYRKSHTVLLII